MDPFSSVTTAHYRTAAALWTAGIVAACLIPASTLSSVQPAVGIDKLVHVVLFAGFGGLWMRALCPPGWADPAAGPPRRTLGVLAVGVVMAVGTEFLQHLAPIRRMGDPFDVIANLVGLLGAVAGYELYRRQHKTTDSPA
ncbi:MAG: VanZ family protein [Salinibacter sp.]